jgi:hypothetical protein
MAIKVNIMFWLENLKERERLEDVLRRWEDNIELCLEWDGLD